MILTLICITILLPVNIAATYNTGRKWPPTPGLGFLTLSAINYPNQSSYNDIWYWCPTIASWLFSVIVVGQMMRSSNRFLRLREKYHTTFERSLSKIEDLVSRTLLIRVDKAVISQEDDKIKYLIDHFSNVTCQHIVLGRYNEHIDYLLKDYQKIIKKTEAAVKRKEQAIHLIKRSLFNEEKTIDDYKNQAAALCQLIQRSCSQLKDVSYLFVIYPSKKTAYKAYNLLKKKTKTEHRLIQKISLAPHPEDIIWSSMHLDQETLQLKSWYGHGLMFSFFFLGLIPTAIVASFSNLINFLRFFGRTSTSLNEYRVYLEIMQSYFAPWIMFLSLVVSIRLLSWISQQQAYKTESTRSQSTLLKSYLFFIIDHIFAFTAFNTMIGIVGQITDLTRPSNGINRAMLSRYVFQIGKNMASSAIYWINYACVNMVGLVFSLVRPLTLLTKSDDSGGFKFSKNYALILSVFTVTLGYSVAAPIVLPFSFIYFNMATLVFKYELIYIYSFKLDTRGKAWPLLYAITVTSVIVFQLIMITSLILKGGLLQVYSLIPLPILTGTALFFYSRYLYRCMSLPFVSDSHTQSRQLEADRDWIKEVYKDPLLSDPLFDKFAQKESTTGPKQEESLNDTKDKPYPLEPNVPYNPYFEGPSTATEQEPSAPALYSILQEDQNDLSIGLPTYTYDGTCHSVPQKE
ncbi:hypothetical protein G6F22_003449 [Rhizopus arrhizus]|nr:hypothetical protein G6F22_003449 [Rhizopus arrhizus]